MSEASHCTKRSNGRYWFLFIVLQPEKSNNPFEEGGDDSNPFAEDMEAEGKDAPQVPLATVNPFQGLVSSCFECHLNIYVESQDRCLQ